MRSNLGNHGELRMLKQLHQLRRADVIVLGILVSEMTCRQRGAERLKWKMGESRRGNGAVVEVNKSRGQDLGGSFFQPTSEFHARTTYSLGQL